jgi:hypothetical protein
MRYLEIEASIYGASKQGTAAVNRTAADVIHARWPDTRENMRIRFAPGCYGFHIPIACKSVEHASIPDKRHAGRLIRALVVIMVGSIWSVAPGLMENDPLISAARKTVAAYAVSLPDYIVKRITQRYISDRGGGREQQDTVSADVAFEHGREVYTHIEVSGQSRSELPGGGWSTGEFSTQMPTILASETATVFTRRRKDTTRKHPSYRYDFAIDQAHSSWHIAAKNVREAQLDLSYTPACVGQLWLDRDSGQVLRIEMSARGLPSSFPVASVETQTDFDLVSIGDGKYLLPTHSRTVSCDGINLCLENETDFRDYDKFSTASSITFEDKKK